MLNLIKNRNEQFKIIKNECIKYHSNGLFNSFDSTCPLLKSKTDYDYICSHLVCPKLIYIQKGLLK